MDFIASYDAIFHADGQIAKGPIALCELQAYVYAAKCGIAAVAAALGYKQQARALKQQAEILRERFEQTFWCDEIGLYALALDKDKRPCRVRSSNAGHCLLTGIASKKRARKLIETFSSEEFFSGWGCARLRVRKSVIIRCPITTALSGRMTML